MKFELRRYQHEAVQSVFDYYEGGKKGNVIIASPTGTGKSLIIAALIQRILNMWGNQRFMVITHVKELLVQNSEKLLTQWPEAPLGMYSAGLKQKDVMQPVIFGGVASVVNSVEAFGHRDLVIVDESHLISPKDDTMYRKVLSGLTEINPHLKVIGLTATPYRLGQGLITDGGIFDDICCDLTGVDSFNRLIAEGFISPLIPKRTAIEIDTTELRIVNGDYGKAQCDDAADRILYEALKETVENGYDRQSWLIFTGGIKSADHAAEILTSFGITAAAVHSKNSAAENDKRMVDFKTGKIRAICGMNKFTTGFDHPPIDLIAMLRPTISPGLHVQILGRGTRPYDGSDPNFPKVKENCLVLDFAGNTKRLGPINDPKIPRKKGKGGGDIPIKICPECNTYNHASARFCCNPECGIEFKFECKLTPTAHTDALLRSDAPVIEMYKVDRVIYHRHEKVGSPPMIKVSYYSGLRRFNEYICLEHSGWAKKRSKDWWLQRHNSEPPEFTDDALAYISQLRTPEKIRVWTNKRFPEIMGVEW